MAAPRPARGLLLAWAIAGGACCAAGGCTSRKDPGAVGDRFMSLYYVEMNQDEALEFAAGRATRMLRHELDEVRSIRASGYTPQEARPSTYFRRLGVEREGDVARAAYTLETHAGPSRVRRRIDLDLRREVDGWRVNDFHQTEVPDVREAR